MYLLHRNTGELSFLQSDQCFMQGSFNGYERDVNNKLWIGSSKGVYVYDHLTGEYEVYNSRNSSLSVNSVFSLKADSKGRMWLGTGGAVFMYDRDDGVFKSDVFRNMFCHILKVYGSFMRIKRRICGFVMIRRGWLR